MTNILDVPRQEDTEEKIGRVLTDSADLQCGYLVIPTSIWVNDSNVLCGNGWIRGASFDFVLCSSFSVPFSGSSIHSS